MSKQKDLAQRSYTQAQRRNIARQNAGVVECRVSQETGRVVTLYRNSEAMLDDDEGRAPFSTVCEDHGWIVCHRTLTLARRHLADPLGWCEMCHGVNARMSGEGEA